MDVRRILPGRRASDLLRSLKLSHEGLGDDIRRLEAVVASLLHEAHTDAFNIWRPEAIHSLLYEKIDEAQTSGTAFSICLLDGDGFSQANAGNRYDVGDVVIREFIARIARSLPPGSDLGHYRTGDELIVILPGWGEAGVSAYAELLRAAVACTPFVTLYGELPLTVSIGTASAPPFAYCGDTLIRAAESALGRAKDNGRNRVMLAHPEI
jgi:diguanylate cyclase (GGDEF)-like protein